MMEANEETVLFHRDDPETVLEDPGAKIEKAWVLELIKKPS